MPANLPPQYIEAEKRFREAREPEEKIIALEDMLAVMPKHKGTDHLKADLRRKIARIQQESEKRPGAQRARLAIPKEGAAQLVVIGLPNGGKSQLVGAVTNAQPAVADYPFTTQASTPGMMEFENVQIQLIDTPPLTAQAVPSWLPNLIRRADGVLVVVDLGGDPVGQAAAIVSQLEGKGIKLGPAGARALVIGNKLDKPGAAEALGRLKAATGLPVLGVSALLGIGLEEMKRVIFEMLDAIRVYTKAPGERPDLTDPIVLPRGATLADAAAAVHKDFAAKLKYARIWGSGKHDGVMAPRHHVLADGDIVELHK